MSDFEYLRHITIGQYLPLDSWVHQRDALLKLLSFSSLILAVTLTNSFFGLTASLITAIFLGLLSKVSWRYSLRSLLSPLPFLLILVILQAFLRPLYSQSVPIIKIFTFGIYYQGILNGVRLFLRFIALVFLLTISSATVSTTELINGIERLLKPLRRVGWKTGAAVMAVQITFRFIPFLVINAEKIAKSQASRGAEWGVRKGNLFKRARQIIPLLLPLFIGSLRQAEVLADAMLAKGYGTNNDRTSLFVVHTTIQDWLLLIAMVSISTSIVLIH